MEADKFLAEHIAEGFKTLFDTGITSDDIQIQNTRKDFTGDRTVVIFPLVRYSKKSPEDTAHALGSYLQDHVAEIMHYEVVRGFLNLEYSDAFWLQQLSGMIRKKSLTREVADPETDPVVVEYSSPNTNKPLHLGHIRNNLIGYSVSKILEANGRKVVKTNIVNDRGIHICKSMLAWEKWGGGETPEEAGLKGDHLVGDYYVRFDMEYRQEVEDLMEQGMGKEEAQGQAPLMKEARSMLLRWERGDPEIMSLWSTMNGWVYEGFDETYKNLGVSFDKIYYESETYKEGKKLVQMALEKGILTQHEDGSIWADLSDQGLDEKLLVRSDGTAVYMTQDIGTAVIRYADYHFRKHIYVVGNEQNYHFQVLKIILQKMGYGWADNLFHMSYGMVELPEGKMKSREGTVVDADDLIEEMIATAREMAMELGKLDDYSDAEKEEIYRIIGLGALKYFILKVDPRKNMTFDPRESIDFNGNTGPFIQYTHARIHSVMRKAEERQIEWEEPPDGELQILEKEKSLIRWLAQFDDVLKEAGENLSPALLANYAFELSKEFNQFYHDHSILGESDANVRQLRILLTHMTGRVIRTAMGLLGIDVPERM
jgi:arginyl-tRNA synthetase